MAKACGLMGAEGFGSHTRPKVYIDDRNYASRLLLNLSTSKCIGGCCELMVSLCPLLDSGRLFRRVPALLTKAEGAEVKLHSYSWLPDLGQSSFFNIVK